MEDTYYQNGGGCIEEITEEGEREVRRNGMCNIEGATESVEAKLRREVEVLREMNGKLLATLEEEREYHERNLQGMTKSLEMMQLQMIELCEKNQGLTEQLKKSEEDNTELLKVLEAQKKELNRTKEPVPFEIHSVCKSEEIKQFQQKFNLPATEYCIESYLCRYGGFAGYASVSPRYVLFESNPITSLPWGSAAKKLVLPITNIKAMKKIKRHSYLPGKGSSVEVSTITGETHVIGSIVCRKEFVKDVVQQAAKAGVRITVIPKDA